MKIPLLVLALSLVLAGPAPAALGEDSGSEEASSVHGGTLTKKAPYLFETAIRAGEVRVYVFDAKGSPLPVAKLRGEATYTGKDGEKVVIALRPAAAAKGSRQGYLAGSHRFSLPAEKGAKLAVGVRGLGDDGKGKATFEVARAETPVVTYECSMHPDQGAEDPGKCAKCGMKLERRARSPAKEKAAYVCSMHPEVRSDRPGKCPKCGMKLVPERTSGTGEETPAKERAAAYVCSMHPEVRSDRPGKCPKCGMKLVKERTSGEGEGTKGDSGGCGM